MLELKVFLRHGDYKHKLFGKFKYLLDGPRENKKTLLDRIMITLIIFIYQTLILISYMYFWCVFTDLMRPYGVPIQIGCAIITGFVIFLVKVHKDKNYQKEIIEQKKQENNINNKQLQSNDQKDSEKVNTSNLDNMKNTEQNATENNQIKNDLKDDQKNEQKTNLNQEKLQDEKQQEINKDNIKNDNNIDDNKQNIQNDKDDLEKNLKDVKNDDLKDDKQEQKINEDDKNEKNTKEQQQQPGQKTYQKLQDPGQEEQNDQERLQKLKKQSKNDKFDKQLAQTTKDLQSLQPIDEGKIHACQRFQMFLIYFPLITCFNGQIDYSLIGKRYDGIDTTSKTNDSFITMWYVLPFYRAIQAIIGIVIYFLFNEKQDYYHFVYLIYFNVGMHVLYLIIFCIEWYYNFYFVYDKDLQKCRQNYMCSKDPYFVIKTDSYLLNSQTRALQITEKKPKIAVQLERLYNILVTLDDTQKLFIDIKPIEINDLMEYECLQNIIRLARRGYQSLKANNTKLELNTENDNCQ